MYDHVCKSKISLFLLKEKQTKKKTHSTSVIGAPTVHEVLKSGQLMGAPVVTSL